MCQRCVESSGDPRTAAFQRLFVVSFITNKEAERLVSTGVAWGDHVIVDDEDTATFHAKALEGNPDIKASKSHVEVFCLN